MKEAERRQKWQRRKGGNNTERVRKSVRDRKINWQQELKASGRRKSIINECKMCVCIFYLFLKAAEFFFTILQFDWIGFTVYYGHDSGKQSKVAQSSTPSTEQKEWEKVRRILTWVWKVRGLRTWAHDCSIRVTLVLSAHKTPLFSVLPQSVGKREKIAVMKTFYVFSVFNFRTKWKKMPQTAPQIADTPPHRLI